MRSTQGKANRKDPAQSNDRRGFVLAVVTFTILVLIVAAYNYSGTMSVEHEAVVMGGRDIVARSAAQSGIELAATRIMEKDTDSTIDFYDDPSQFSRQLVVDSANERGKAYFAIVAPDETNTTTGGTRFGLGNESQKFNINLLLELYQIEEALPEEEQVGLVYLATENIPNMTEDIIDAVLDWLDADDDRRPYGAESGDYEGLSVPYECKNGPMDSIEELLKVQGVTPELFYGEDANGNGLLDANENDGDASLPMDNGDGILDLGWKDYLTARSRERNTNPDGDQKINLNMGEMTSLYDAVEELYGEEAASFVVAYRIGGTEYAMQGIPELDSNITEKISRNDIDLTIPPTFQFQSIYDLIGGVTNPVQTYSGGPKTFESPWTEDPGSIINDFPELEKYLTISDDAYEEGRVNINQARYEVLMAVTSSVPDIPTGLADDIINARPQAGSGSSPSIMANRQTAAWLFVEGHIDIQQLRDLGPYITTGGDVYRFQSVGHFGEGGPTTRLEAMIDATISPPQIVFVRDMTSLGRGYHPQTLMPDLQE